MGTFEADMQERIGETERLRPAPDPDDGAVESTLRFLSEPERESLLRVGSTWTVGSGETVVRAGEDLDALFYLAEGMLRVLDRTGEPIGRVFPGEVFGEISLLTVVAATSDVVAAADSEIIAVPRRELFDMLRLDPALAMRFYQSLSVLLADRLMRQNDLIRGLDESGE